MDIVPLRPERFGDAGAVAARAFYDDPMWSFVTPDAGERLRKSAWVLEHWARVLAPLGASWVALEDGTVAGVAMWFPPGRFDVPLGRMLAAGYWRMPLDLGVRWTVRSWSIFWQGVHHQESLMGRTRYWVLDVLAVDPSRQGKGIGRALVETGLKLADEQKVASFVVTHKKSNVPFYERFGFGLVDQHAVGGGGPVGYSLRRAAKA